MKIPLLASIQASPWACIIAVWLTSAWLADGATKDYVFDVGYFQIDPDGSGYGWTQGINGTVPGPEIRVRNGDRLRVKVINNCQTELVSIHWHGFEMKNAQEYDGAMPITQCGIHPSHSMMYDFIVNEAPGTFQYHEHQDIGHVANRGLHGVLIVEEGPNDPVLWTYDNDVSLALSDYWHHSNHELERQKFASLVRPPTISAQGNGVGLLPFHNLLINGKGAFNVYAPQPPLALGYVTEKRRLADLYNLVPKAGETWRLRINNIGNMFAIRFRIDGHRMRVIQSDGGDVDGTFLCDAITLSSGERYDVLVTWNQDPGNYWMRAETLEHGYDMHHGQLGVLRYEGVDPNADFKGFPRNHMIEESPSLVTLNCVDQAKTSSTCVQVTSLRRHPQFGNEHGDVGTIDDETHDFEVSLRAFGGMIDGHFTRIIDLKEGPNPYGANQFDGGYHQFMPPKVPYSFADDAYSGLHPATMHMTVHYGEVVRVVLQSADRAAHPWHVHGHKFAVLGMGYPDYDTQCDIIYCRSENNHWITRDGAMRADGKHIDFGQDKENVRSLSMPMLLDPAVAPLKDTITLPAGGWVVIQFKANNPGWWYFHCHMAVHVHDGMGFVLVEAEEQIPARLKNATYLYEQGFPSCEEDKQKVAAHGPGKACNCWQNPDMKWDNFPRDNYICARTYLCGDWLPGNPLVPQQATRMPHSDRHSMRVDGRWFRWVLVAVWLLLVMLLFWYKWYVVHHFKKHYQSIQSKTSGSRLKHWELGEMVMEVGDNALRVISNVAHRTSHHSTQGHGHVTIATDQEVVGVDEAEKPSGSDIEGMSTKRVIPTTTVKTTALEEAKEVMGLDQPQKNSPEDILQRKTNANFPEDIERTPLSIAKLNRKELCTEKSFSEKSMPSNRTLMFDTEEKRDRQWEYTNSLSAVACCGLKKDYGGMEPGALIHLPAGSLCVVLGKEDQTTQWVEFFALRRQKGPQYVHGNITLGNRHVKDWDRRDLRQAVTFIPHGQKITLRSNIFVLESLDLYMKLGCSSHVHPTWDDRREYRNRLIEIFQLSEWLDKQIKDLPPAIFLQLCIARELLLPRSLIVLESPIDSFDETDQRTVIQMLYTVVQDLKVTVVFSSEGVMSKVAKYCTHGLVISKQCPPIFGTEKDINEFLMCCNIAQPDKIPEKRKKCHSFEHCSDLIAKHKLVDIVSTVGMIYETSSHHILTAADIVQQKMHHLVDEFHDVHKDIKYQSMLSPEKIKTKLFRKQPHMRSHGHRRLSYQIFVLLEFEFRRGLKDSITIYRLVETIGIAIFTGIVWLHKGSEETQTALGETIGLLFFSTALWTVPPIFQALSTMPIIMNLASHEFLGGLYSLVAFTLAMTLASTVTLTLVWPPLWQLISYAFADVGATVPIMLTMVCMMSLHVLTMRTLGLCLALIVPSAQTNVVIANLFAQLCMLTNGFYSTLPDWFQPITVISIPRYTLKALLKLEFSWEHGFLVDPMSGNPAWGFPTRYIPAQLTGTFLTMHQRKMDIMRSFQDSTAFWELGTLFGLTCVCQILFTIGLLTKITHGEGRRHKYEASAFDIFSQKRWCQGVIEKEDKEKKEARLRKAVDMLVAVGEREFCSHCRTHLVKGAKFCYGCGNVATAAKAAPPSGLSVGADTPVTSSLDDALRMLKNKNGETVLRNIEV